MIDLIGAPKGNRTPVFAVRGRRPGPLDDGSHEAFWRGRSYIEATRRWQGGAAALSASVKSHIRERIGSGPRSAAAGRTPTVWVPAPVAAQICATAS